MILLYVQSMQICRTRAIRRANPNNPAKKYSIFCHKPAGKYGILQNLQMIEIMLDSCRFSQYNIKALY